MTGLSVTAGVCLIRLQPLKMCYLRKGRENDGRQIWNLLLSSVARPNICNSKPWDSNANTAEWHENENKNPQI